MKPPVLVYGDMNVVHVQAGNFSGCKFVTWIINVRIVGLK